ncbi:glutathione S-transferase N-terminal domain-containing protein [Alkalilimnicola sp. S0819]|uniref:glutathione S-transferase N-terminal domain-containing protein n=1 Tax=Alkalilimnicola sp. S0819 TaxID=2613922 RepID=UPI0012614766|nr:glutathione S-transferase N-terminal domain-containing protein [Alkalilimnicola sp. S0819]KAB7623841.1 stringent starvation protein A [Alkalilimnicola sp. S0819]MPQ16717.1 stringent starvation protein A [Alkalilimnicola sp. S0819]
MAAVSKRSIMTLYSGPTCPFSHRVRFVLAEKGIAVEIQSVEGDQQPEDLVDLNPYGSVPTLVDRDLALYDTKIICEYLDERFPHPPLMPVDPVSRAKARLVLYRIEADWYGPLARIIAGTKADQARKELRESLTAAADLFAAQTWFLNEELSVMDCAVGPLLWRLPFYGVELPEQAKAVNAYAERLFALESFQNSLSEQERNMRP